MKGMRIVLMIVVASGLAKVAGLGAWWLASATPASAASDGAAATSSGEVSDARGFRELLEAVRARADALDRREAELRTREAGLATVRRAVAGEIGRLEDVAKALGVVGAPGPAMSIARVYESMRAEDAAPILDRLDDSTLRAVLSRMRERQVGAILAAMSRERAVAVTKTFVAPTAPAAGPSRP